MSDTLYELYPLFLDAGHSPEQYWCWTPGMISDAVESYARQRKNQVDREDAIMRGLIAALYTQAAEIRDGVVSAFNADAPIHTIGWYYPELFPDAMTEDEKAAWEERQKSEEDLLLARQKAAMEDVVYYQNRAFRAKHMTENPEVSHDTTGAQGTDISTDSTI